MKHKPTTRHIVLLLLLSAIWATQYLPALAEMYARSLYPVISNLLSSFSRHIPLAVGDLFIFLSLVGLLAYPIGARCLRKEKWRKILLHEAEYLLWIYAWFYLAWGLNYSQKGFYERTQIPYAAYTPERFQSFTDGYVRQLNAAYTDSTAIDEPQVCRETIRGYLQIADTLGVHHPAHPSPRAKTMLFTPLMSKVGITGSMGPFFCEFTLNGHLPPSQYPATYAHELAHLLGITSEAEANFYAYQVCSRSQVKAIRFSGYLSILPHVLSNARRLMNKDEYAVLVDRIRPEVIRLYQKNRQYWLERYSPSIGKMQDFIYDLYLKGNHIPSGRQNYSEVIGLLISYESWQQSHHSFGKRMK